MLVEKLTPGLKDMDIETTFNKRFRTIVECLEAVCKLKITCKVDKIFHKY